MPPKRVFFCCVLSSVASSTFLPASGFDTCAYTQTHTHTRPGLHGWCIPGIWTFFGHEMNARVRTRERTLEGATQKESEREREGRAK
uniref:Putative secreted protein n=1 Tax=Anopheles darlingi TaxID=43151 RepID=A0A2M4D7P7_ANODA